MGGGGAAASCSCGFLLRRSAVQRERERTATAAAAAEAATGRKDSCGYAKTVFPTFNYAHVFDFDEHNPCIKEREVPPLFAVS